MLWVLSQLQEQGKGNNQRRPGEKVLSAVWGSEKTWQGREGPHLENTPGASVVKRWKVNGEEQGDKRGWCAQGPGSTGCKAGVGEGLGHMASHW